MNTKRRFKNFLLNKQVAPPFFFWLNLFLQAITKEPYLEMENDGPD